jgi:hypothetical protein
MTTPLLLILIFSSRDYLSFELGAGFDIYSLKLTNLKFIC